MFSTWRHIGRGIRFLGEIGVILPIGIICITVWGIRLWLILAHDIGMLCETPRKSNFLKKGKIVILIKIQNFSRSWMMKRTSSLESSREI